MCWERVEYNTRWLVLVLVIARAFGYTQINCLDTIFPFAVISSFFPQYFLLSDSKRSLCSEFPMTSRVCRFVCRCVARSGESNTSNRVLQSPNKFKCTVHMKIYCLHCCVSSIASYSVPNWLSLATAHNRLHSLKKLYHSCKLPIIKMAEFK